MINARDMTIEVNQKMGKQKRKRSKVKQSNASTYKFERSVLETNQNRIIDKRWTSGGKRRTMTGSRSSGKLNKGYTNSLRRIKENEFRTLLRNPMSSKSPIRQEYSIANLIDGPIYDNSYFKTLAGSKNSHNKPASNSDGKFNRKLADLSNDEGKPILQEQHLNAVP